MSFDEWWDKNRSEFTHSIEKSAAKKVWQAATLAEREGCAKVVESRTQYEIDSVT